MITSSQPSNTEPTFHPAGYRHPLPDNEPLQRPEHPAEQHGAEGRQRQRTQWPPGHPFDVLVVGRSRSAGGFELGEQVLGSCRGGADGLTQRHQVCSGVAAAEVPDCRL